MLPINSQTVDRLQVDRPLKMSMKTNQQVEADRLQADLPLHFLQINQATKMKAGRLRVVKMYLRLLDPHQISLVAPKIKAHQEIDRHFHPKITNMKINQQVETDLLHREKMFRLHFRRINQAVQVKADHLQVVRMFRHLSDLHRINQALQTKAHREINHHFRLKIMNMKISQMSLDNLTDQVSLSSSY